jgi:hypothetical protein
LIHETAPYLALDSSGEKFKLLIVKKNYNEQLNPGDCITQNELDSIIKGFNSFMEEIKIKLIRMINGSKVDFECQLRKRFVVIKNI